MATDPLDVPPGSLTLEAITDLLEGGGGTPPGGATGDLQLNNGGVFGNANDIFPGAVLEIDATENFIIDLSANGGALLFTGGAIIANVAGNLDFESTGGDVTFFSSGGGVELQGTQVLVSAIGGDVTIGSANGSLEINEDGTINLTASASNLNCTAAAGNVAFVANNQYTAGATTVVLNAGGDTTLTLDSSVSPETITLDSDLSNTKIFIGKSTGLAISIGGPSSHIGFFNTTPIAKPTITGAKAGNTALASVLTQLAALGLITDSTT